MKRILKALLTLLTILLVAFVIFFFWGSAPQHDEKKYSVLINNGLDIKAPADSVYKLITYNIGYLSGMLNNLPVAIPESLHSANLQSVRAEIKKIDADILCFQEIDYESRRSFYVNQQDAIAKLGYNYVFQAVNWDKTYVPFPYFPISVNYGKIYSGQSVLSKFPIKDPERIVLEKVKDDPFYRTAFYLDRLAQVCKLDIEGRALVLINVHLEAFNSETRQNQCDYIASLYNKYKDDYPVLLVGDFNSDPRLPDAVINQILALEDIGVACGDSDSGNFTFPSDEPIGRIDYIFYNKNFIRELNSRVLTSFGQASDHLPVLLEFSLY